MSAGTDLDLTEVIFAERLLLHATTSGDRDALERILAPDFTEIGKVGRLWSRPEVIESLVQDGGAAEIEAADFTAAWVSRDLVLLTCTATASQTTTRRTEPGAATP